MAKAKQAAKPVTETGKRAYTAPQPMTDAEREAKTTALVAAQSQMSTIPGFKVKRAVTMPVLKMEAEKIYALKFLSAFRVSEYKGEQDEKAADICNVADVQTGAIYTFLVSAVVKKNLEELRDDNNEPISYVGRVFALQKLPKRPGKRYYDYNIVEIEETESAE